MRSRLIAGSLLVLTSLILLMPRIVAAPAVKWAAVNFTDTVSIAGVFVSGPVVFVHDDARMARGEPCTSVHRFVADKGIREELVAFHCKPRWGKAPGAFTKTTSRVPGGPPVLTAYQFAGDEEAHLVPAR